MKEKVLVIAAHPDDETLGCGATVAKHSASGDNCRILILSRGLRARGEVEAEQIEALMRQAHAASKILQSQLTILDFPDNAMDSVPLLHIIQAIEAEIRQFSPTIIYTHSCCDLNIDHTTTHRATLTAARPMLGSSVKQIWAYEVLSSTEWGFSATPVFQPQRFVDVSGFLDKKIQAMQCYVSETQAFPHPRSSEAITALASRRGAQCGCHAAEAFQLVYALDR